METNQMFIWTWALPRPIGLVQAHHKYTYTRPRATWERTLASQTLHTSRPLPLHNSFSIAVPRATHRRPRAATSCRRTCSDYHDEEIPFVTNSLGLLVQTDEGVVNPVLDWIRRTTAANREVPVSL
ncbi:hypothetical protein F511_16486 [Dorcoceras hygrometricum]|uniref:Uncharacterized protein n=1 Tax=Dorcoceras hygrometricum TaxID=472368 RepID=A0A2Z7BA51_9LAMI|nr:hypothetical protein F511_16486 [Dorcoceras hygrometricum]